MDAPPSASAVKPGSVAAQTLSSHAPDSLTTQQIYAILERLRPKHGLRVVRDHRTESETKQVCSGIIKRILSALFELKLKAKMAESPNTDSEELWEELEIERPFVGRGLDLVSYAGMDRNGHPRTRPFCNPDEMLQFKSLWKDMSDALESASSDRGSGSAVSDVSSSVPDSIALGGIDPDDIQVVKQSALPLHKLTGGSIIYESPLELEAPGLGGLLERMAVVIEDKASNGNAELSHKQIGTYVRIAYPIDGCAFGIVFHGLHFRIYQLVSSQKPNAPPDLMTWIPAGKAGELPDEMTWQESLSQDFPMFCFDLSATRPIMQPAVLVKFLDAITISIAAAIEKQKTFDPMANSHHVLLKFYNPSLDLLTQPVDFSTLKYETGRAVAKSIRITGLTLPAMLAGHRPKLTTTLPKLTTTNLERLGLGDSRSVESTCSWLDSVDRETLDDGNWPGTRDDTNRKRKGDDIEGLELDDDPAKRPAR